MSYRYIVDGLASLESHPDLMEYVKSFNGSGGFMFTVVTDPAKKQLEKRLEDILNSNGMHSGGSWGFMLRGIQAVLCGTYTRDYFIEKMAQEEEDLKRFHEELNKRDAEREAAKKAQSNAAAQSTAAQSNAATAELLSRINTIE